MAKLHNMKYWLIVMVLIMKHRNSNCVVFDQCLLAPQAVFPILGMLIERRNCVCLTDCQDRCLSALVILVDIKNPKGRVPLVGRGGPHISMWHTHRQHVYEVSIYLYLHKRNLDSRVRMVLPVPKFSKKVSNITEDLSWWSFAKHQHCHMNKQTALFLYQRA